MLRVFSKKRRTYRVPATKFDHLDRRPGLPKAIIFAFKLVLLVLSLPALALVGHINIWLFDHPGLTLVCAAVIAIPIVIYNLHRITPEEPPRYRWRA